MKLYGKTYGKEEILKYIDIAPAKEFMYTAGKSAGVKGVLITTGDLSFSVLKDRGLDISDATYKGIPLSYQSKTGQTAPGEEFLRGFFGGLLTTCGLLNAGAACQENGVDYPLHGSHSNTPAYDIGVSSDWEKDELITTITGKIKSARVFGENLILHRKITTAYGKNEIMIHDKIENRSFEKTEYMLLYHVNFGFPFLNKDATLFVSTDKVSDFNGYSDVSKCHLFNEPINNYKEEVFIHDAGGKKTTAELSSMGICLKMEFENLPYLIEWKQTGEGDYALGLEPSTNKPYGRVNARQDGELLCLDPMQTVKYSLKLSIENI